MKSSLNDWLLRIFEKRLTNETERGGKRSISQDPPSISNAGERSEKRRRNGNRVNMWEVRALGNRKREEEREKEGKQRRGDGGEHWPEGYLETFSWIDSNDESLGTPNRQKDEGETKARGSRRETRSWGSRWRHLLQATATRRNTDVQITAKVCMSSRSILVSHYLEDIKT